MITLDTSGLFAIMAESDEHHTAAVAAIAAERGPLVVPAEILCELGYLLDREFGHSLVDAVRRT